MESKPLIALTAVGILVLGFSSIRIIRRSFTPYDKTKPIDYSANIPSWPLYKVSPSLLYDTTPLISRRLDPNSIVFLCLVSSGR
jgi:hypothetical protein